MPFMRHLVVGVKMPAARPWNPAELPVNSREAVARAFEVTDAARIPVTLVSVLPSPGSDESRFPDQGSAAGEADRVSALAVLEDLRKHYTRQSISHQIDTLVVTGNPWEELIRTAETLPRCLLVCGDRDHADHRSPNSEVVEQLLRHAFLNVWFVKPQNAEKEPPDIVVAANGRQSGSNVISAAVDIAKSLCGRLHIVHAVDPKRYSPEAVHAAEQVLQKQLAETDYRTLPFGLKIVITEATVPDCLPIVVSEADADLLIVGAPSKPDAAALLPESVVEKLLPALPCSVMVLKADSA